MSRKRSEKTVRQASRTPAPAKAGTIRFRDIGFVLALAGAIWCTNAVWLKLDSRLPVWDMAMHQVYALNYVPGTTPQSPQQPLWTLSGIYPPFVHILIAAAYMIFHPGTHVAVLANLPSTVLLLLAIYSLSTDLAGPAAGRWTCLIVALTPYMLWMSRETILDYWLSAWVAASLAVLLRTEAFRSRRYSVVLGFVLAFGLLTKWLFAAFLFIPIVYASARGAIWKERAKLMNFGLALVIAILLASLWYVPNLSNLVRYIPENARIGEMEGEPPVFSFQSAIYYLRLLEGYQMFAVLFVLTALSLIVAGSRRLIRDSMVLGAALGGAWLLLTLIRTKDPRFTMPLLGMISIFPAAWLASWGRSRLAIAAKCILVSTLCLQAYAINFGIAWIPQKVVLAEGYQGSLRWDWNLYLQNYFDILGPPRIENWKQSEILARVEQDAVQTGLRRTLALVPDLPRFSAANFLLCARLLGRTTEIGRLILTNQGIYPLDAVDYVVTADGEQGMSWTTATSRELNRIIEGSPAFQLVEGFALPEGNFARLYRVRHEEFGTRR